MSATTVDETLLYVPGADAGSTQWRLATMQMVNWGNFDGYHSVDFDPLATLITGGSGSGKSTLLDAYTAVMMGSDVPFNGASNQARGRARSDKQRNLVSYLRGQYSATDDGDGGARAQVLRGADRHTWGAVALTFTTTEGDEVFTALRVWFVPRGTVRDTDVIKRILTVPARVDLRELQPLAADRFVLKDLRELIPGVRNHEAYAAFVTTLETSLGLGSGGDGGAALKMLSRVQSSAALDNVDALFKQTVLDEPRTFSTAADVLGHFEELERSYAELERAYARQSQLAPLRDLDGKLVTARAAVTAHDHARWGDPHGPASLWKSRVRVDCLDAAEDASSQLRTAAELASSAATAKVADTNLARRASESAYNAAGGDRLAHLTTVIDHLRGKVNDREQRVERLRAAVGPLGVRLDSTDALSHAVAEAPDRAAAENATAEQA
ncbi:MAG: ATP-binding protein, partial [Candidatus Phosphoribacter sp.]